MDISEIAAQVAEQVVEQIAEHNASKAADLAADLEHAAMVLARSGKSAEAVVKTLAEFSVAAPSWAVGTGGTRFGRFPMGGEPRDTFEKLDDVAALNALTGANRTISLHVPWDNPSDPEALRIYADERGIAFDAMNSNTFQDIPSTTQGGAISYKFGSLANVDDGARKAT